MRYRVILIFFIQFICALNISSQESDNGGLIQFSGNTLVSYGDSIEPVAFVLIKNRSRNSGSYSGPDGFFSLVVKRGDTVEFSSVGFRKSTLIIPQEIRKDRFNATQTMIRDTHRLREAIIVPWKNIDELRRAVVDLDVSEDDLVIAYQNMQYERWSKLRESLPPSPEENRRFVLNDRQTLINYQTTGLLPPNNILNPFTWAAFIDQLSKKKKKQNIDIDNKYQK